MDLRKHEKIRKEFNWTKNYDKHGNRLKISEKALLKDLETNHILGILKYFTQRLNIQKYEKFDICPINQQWKNTHLLFINELLYRSEYNIL